MFWKKLYDVYRNSDKGQDNQIIGTTNFSINLINLKKKQENTKKETLEMQIKT